MKIQKDSGEILVYLYNKYVSRTPFFVTHEELLNGTKWDKFRLERAVKYLDEKGLIKVTFFLGKTVSFDITKLYPDAIDIVEDNKKFEKSFGFEVGIPGIFKFSWKTTEK